MEERIKLENLLKAQPTEQKESVAVVHQVWEKLLQEVTMVKGNVRDVLQKEVSKADRCPVTEKCRS